MAKIILLFLFGVSAAKAQIITSDTIADRNGIAQDTVMTATQNYMHIDKAYWYRYKKPRFWEMFRYVPDDIRRFGEFTVTNENLKWDALAVGSTAALIPLDQSILDRADDLGQKLGGWDRESHYRKLGGVLNIIPENISSAVYYIGNGGTALLLSGFFYGIGKCGEDDYRALNTSSELIEGLLAVGIVTQTVKRITGRQSPGPALADGVAGGKWQPFPSFNAFQRDTPNYDAMPSGHIATYMATLTIITMNYPEKKWIRPVGYGLMGVVAFNMVSTKVHWASDYPIAILMGYVIGKNVAERRMIKIAKNPTGSAPKRYRITYGMQRLDDTTLIGAAVTF